MCFRCGYRAPKAATVPPLPAQTPTLPTRPSTATSTGPRATPVPAPVPAASPGPRGDSSDLRGRITTLGAPRVELVELAWGDALVGIVSKLALVVVLIMGTIVFFPVVVILLLVMLFVPALRTLLPMSMLFMRGRGGRDPQSQRREVEIPITPFTLATDDGRTVEVELRGELHGGSPHLGDTVEVRGHMSRNGTIAAQRVTNTATGASITTREHPAVVRSRVQATASIAAMIVLALVLVGLFQYISQIL